MSDNLWSRGDVRRHRELYDAEYAKQLERIARIRSEVSAGLPQPPPPPEPPAAPRAPARWDAAPTNLAPVAPSRRCAAGDATATPGRAAPRRAPTPATAAPQEAVAPPRVRDSSPPGGRSRAPRFSPRHARLATAVGAAVASGFAAIAIFGGRAPQQPAATVFRVPGQPTGLAVDGGRVWVAGPATGEVWVLDGASGRAARPALRIGGTPARLALDRRFAWVADTARGAVVRAPRDGSGTPHPVRGGPDIADVAVAGGAVWTASSADGSVHVIGPRGDRRSLRVGARLVALAADGRRVVAADASGSVIHLDARARRAAGGPISVGGTPSDIALSGDRAWIADMRAGTVRVVALRPRVPGPATALGCTPVAIAADRRGVYALCRDERTLVGLDAAGTIRSRRRLPQSPTALALDSRHVWIAAGEHEVIRVDR
jgi:DNA-binding beta-propeller fold protein YncE